MIALRETVADIDQIKQQHVNFVAPYVGKMIAFYKSIFEVLPSLQHKRIADKIVIEKIKSIQSKHECGHYKRLLKYMLKANIDLKNESQLVELKYENKLKPAAKKNKEIVAALTSLQANFQAILELDFSTDQAQKMSQYKLWQSEYDHIKFLLDGIFDYDHWFLKCEPSEAWGPYQLAQALQINTCPYCNRQYTFSLVDGTGKKKGRPDFDHFIPQSQHPLLALTFFNLVPSCKACNGPSMKAATPTSYDTHLNPYEPNANSALMKFTYYPNTYEASIGASDDVDIGLKYAGDPLLPHLKTKVEGNIKMFALDEIYKKHTDVVQEIIRKRAIASDRYIEVLQHTFKDFNLSLEDAYRLAFGNYYHERDFLKRPVAKLTKDIAIEAKILIFVKKDS
jgi:hypothetical protein